MFEQSMPQAICKMLIVKSSPINEARMSVNEVRSRLFALLACSYGCPSRLMINSAKRLTGVDDCEVAVSHGNVVWVRDKALV